MSEIKLRPFKVPVEVQEDRACSYQFRLAWPLHTVDAVVLAAMCDEWRRSVFAKAGKEDPREEK